MIPPRWHKVLRDTISYKVRTLLVVAAITLGVAAIGTILGADGMIRNDLPIAFHATAPAHIYITLSEFDDALVKRIQQVPGVVAAEGQRRLTVRVCDATGAWQDLRLLSIRRFDQQQVNKVFYQAGQWPPAKGELLLERSSLHFLGMAVGDQLTIEINGKEQRSLRLVGVAHDLQDMSARFTNQANGYIAIDTMGWLTGVYTYNRLLVRLAEPQATYEQIQAIAHLVEKRLQRGGYTVWSTYIPQPDTHEFQQFLDPFSLLLGTLGVLTLLLSGFLVTNLIMALLAQQKRQIGIMKTIGASSHQILGLYIGLVLFFGLLALLMALPLSWLGARALARYMAGLINFDIVSPALPWWVVTLEAFVALGVPLLAAWLPVVGGMRLTVREAIQNDDASKVARSNWGDCWLADLHWLSRPQLLSLRNTLRRKSRLLLTVLTLTSASMIFISVLSVRASLSRTLDDAYAYWDYDLSLNFSKAYRRSALLHAADQIPGVATAEVWGFHNALRQRPNGSQSADLLLITLPLPAKLIQPTVVEGRWLQPTDTNAVVVNTDLLADESDIKVGDKITLTFDQRDTQWQVVGVVRGVLAGSFLYANHAYFAQAIGRIVKADSVHIKLDTEAKADEQTIREQIRTQFKRRGFLIRSIDSSMEERQVAEAQFTILVIFLSLMALLLAVVGGLGLMGTMSLNVLERQREIGVMRAIGATNYAILQIIILEGVLIGLLSWVLGTLAALPVSKLLSAAVGAGFINADLSYSFSLAGALGWCLIMIILSILASFWPAYNAMQLTVRETLAYEG